MLILTRRIGETLVIGEGPNRAEVTILGINGPQIRLGAKAPKEVPIHRQEIYWRIQEKKFAESNADFIEYVDIPSRSKYMEEGTNDE